MGKKYECLTSEFIIKPVIIELYMDIVLYHNKSSSLNAYTKGCLSLPSHMIHRSISSTSAPVATAVF